MTLKVRAPHWGLTCYPQKLPSFSLFQRGFDFADPFLLFGRYLLYEKLCHSEGIGRIYCYDIENLFEYPLFDNMIHVSYPHVFEVNSNIYMLPEQSLLSKLCAYKIHVPTLRIKSDDRISVSGEYKIFTSSSIVDATTFYFCNRLYLLFNYDLGHTGDPGGALFISELDKYTFKPSQPMLLSADSRNCRLAGYAKVILGSLYFTTQTRQKKAYGCGLELMRLNVSFLTQGEPPSLETVTDSLSVSGIHHFSKSSLSGGIAFDWQYK